MAGPIRVDLEDAQQCSAVKMIEFLFAFCLKGDDRDIPGYGGESLERAFQKVKEIATRNETPLQTELSEL